MPKQTFFNLPDDKKLKLIDAAKKEFSRAPLFEASISNIVKSARIPRGSFYQYFEDKDDAYFYLLNEISMNTKRQFAVLLGKNNGDIFTTMIDFFKLIIEEEENFNLFKNAFLNMTYKMEHYFTKMLHDEEQADAIKKVESLINKNRLNIVNDEDLTHVMKIISAITIHNIARKFAKDLSNEEALANYTKEIDLVKMGLAKK